MIFVEQFYIRLVSVSLNELVQLAQLYSMQSMSEIFGLITAFATGALSRYSLHPP